MSLDILIISSQIAIAIVAILGLTLSMVALRRKKPKIYFRKDIAKFKEGDKKIIEFYFFIGNLGEMPASIENLQFYTQRRFMPRRKFVKVVEEFLPSSKILVRWGMEKISLPFSLMPHSSIKLKAELEFPSEEESLKAINEKNQFHFNARLTFNGEVIHKEI